jgi:threonine dehydratase
MIDRSDINAARERIAPRIRRTPVIEIEAGGLVDNLPVALKLEHLQITGSFKLRGAFNNILTSDVGDAGVVAASGGNFGAAVAYAATQLGVRSTIFVPQKLATDEKLARMRGFGAEVKVAEGTVSEAMQQYLAYAEETGAVAFHPYDTLPTLAGQGTLGAEIEEQLPDIDTLFVSVGGGGLIGGIAAWFERRIRVIAVETGQTATLDETLKTGREATLQPSGIAASSLGGPNIGALPLDVLTRHLHSNIVVSDADVFAAQRRLWDGVRIIGEPGAAVALAPLTSGIYTPEDGERVAVLVCGGNAAPDWFLQ